MTDVSNPSAPPTASNSTAPPSINNIPSHARLAIWLNKLPQNPLPIDTAIAKQLLRLLKDDDCDCNKLAQLAIKDPILSLKLFHCTEEQLQQRQGDIQHMAHLISLLGFGKLEKVIRNSQCKQKKQHGFQEILSASLFAAHLASSLLSKRHGASNDRFFLPTLFFNSPLWLMWVAAPKTMSQGQVQASREQQSYIALSVKKLGFRLPDLLSKAHSFIHLPESTLKALAINPKHDINFWAKAHRLNDKKFAYWLKEDGPARQKFYSIESGIYLLNQYVISVYLDWHGKHIQRYSSLLCRHLKIDNTELNTHVIDLAMSIDLPNSFKGLLSPINRLRGAHKEIENCSKSAMTSNPEKSRHTIESWLKKIQQSQSVDNALEMAMQALAEGVGVEHCLIMTVDEQEIHTQSHYGFNGISAITDFHQPINQSVNLFQQLIKKPACIAISSQDLPRAMKKMPDQFAQHYDLKPCGLLSVFHHNKPKALIYCDQSQWDTHTHQHFKTVGKHLSHTLKHL